MGAIYSLGSRASSFFAAFSKGESLAFGYAKPSKSRVSLMAKVVTAQVADLFKRML